MITLIPHSRPRMNRWVAPSLLLHALVLTAILHHRHMFIAPMKLPGNEDGHLLTLNYIPGHAGQRALVSTPHPPLPAAKVLNPRMPSPARPVEDPAASTSTIVNPSSGASGSDSLGSGNVTVALATFFPRPKPDLPAHTRGDVIVDVVIDETGKIIDTKVAQSLGPSIDQSVLATIQTWTFTPATRDGKPIPSEQELLFHYERG